MTRILRFVIAAMLAVGLSGLLPRLASAEPGREPFIRSAHADFDLFRLRITGENFGSSPRVWLGETLLVVESATNSEITVLLGGPVEPGSYLLTVARSHKGKDDKSKGKHNKKDDDDDDEGRGSAKLLFTTFDVTIGAQGPQGAQGEQGVQGVQGNDGPAGEKGDKGDKGDPGASPFRLVGPNAVYTDGNVGVGTETPSALAQVGPGQDFGNITTIGASQRPQDTVGLSVRSDFQRPTFQFCASGPCNYIQMDRASQDLWFGDFNTPSMVVRRWGNGGNVGVKSTVPTAHLQVGSPQGPQNQFGFITTVGIWQQTTDTVGLSIRRSLGNPVQQFCGPDNDCNYVEMDAQNHNLLFGTGGFAGAGGPATLTVQRTDQGGQVGIGTRTPTATLQVGAPQGPEGLFGDITTVGVWQQTDDTVGLSIRRSGQNNPVQQFCVNDCNYIEMDWSNHNLLFGTSGFAGPATMTVGRLHFGGGVGIHQAPEAGHTLAVAGSVIADAYATRSSRRLKTDIETLTGALDMVGRMRGVSYTVKATGRPEIGLIAEEVQGVIPQVVASIGDNTQGVDYARIVAVLIEAVKEQQAQIHSLRQELTSLTAALAAAAQR